MKHQGEGTRAAGQEFCLLQPLGVAEEWGTHGEHLGLLSDPEVVLEAQTDGATGSSFALSVPECSLSPVTCNIHGEEFQSSVMPRGKNTLFCLP